MRSMEEKSTSSTTGDAAKIEQEGPRPMDEAADDLSTSVAVAETDDLPAESGVAPAAAADDDDEMHVAEVETVEGCTADGGTTTQEQTGRNETSSFARLVKGWEALAEAGARNVQRARENENFQPLQMLQSLSLCGARDGLARIGAPPADDTSEDPFEPIILRHTRSTPQQYQPMFPDDTPPAPVRLEHMRRSSSTPSSSAFRRYSSHGSAHLRSMPHLGGPDDRSAFTLPSQRTSFASLSDSGVRYSAFDPVWLPQPATDATEDTAIEVMDVNPDEKEVSSSKEGKTNKSATSRAARFLRMSESRNKRRRKRKGDRENPARPTSISVSSQSMDEKDKPTDIVDQESNPPADSSIPEPKSTIGIDISTTPRTPTPTPQLPAVQEHVEGDNAATENATSGDQYQQLDSDVDEEYEHYQRIETSLQQTESPTPIPSPAYQKFEDDQAPQTDNGTGSSEAEGGNRTPTVRIQVSSGAGANQEGCSLTPNSHESGNQSPGTIRSSMTGNTSAGHTTLATSTSATTSSGHTSVLSSVSETDMEVMETNQAGKMRVRQQRKLDKVVKRGDADSSMSIHSSSTGSTNTAGYVALVGSPAPLRDGASMPVDRFFEESRLSVTHSVSNISGSTGSSTGRTGGTSKSSSDSSKKALGQGSPASVSSDMSTANSPRSGEEPPQFVSYLDQEKNKVLRPIGDDEERESSPAEIVGYSEMVFEAATVPGQRPKKPALVRPMQKRDGKDRSGRFGSRPPLSPSKGLRTPTTPPPSVLGGPDAASPAYQQLSPPRNIVDHRMGAGGLSKPYVLRSSARPGDGRGTHMFVSPESEQIEKSSKGCAQDVATSLVGGILSPETSRESPVYMYTAEPESTDPIGRICEEKSIEVKDAPVVSPEKGA